MPTIGTDCQLILDGIGYWIEPATYKVMRARIRRADQTGVAANQVGPGAGAGGRYIDRGPGKRAFQFIIGCFNNMLNYAGTTIYTTGQQLNENLQPPYNKVNQQIAFTDPA